MMNGQRAVAVVGEHNAHPEQNNVAPDDDGGQPPGQDAPHRQPDEGGEDKQAVRGRVEELSETRDLVEAARNDPVEVVGDAGDHQNDQGEDVFARDQQTEKNGHQAQANKAQNIGHGENLCAQLRLVCHKTSVYAGHPTPFRDPDGSFRAGTGGIAGTPRVSR